VEEGMETATVVAAAAAAAAAAAVMDLRKPLGPFK
jgi:hypothetical protein